MKRIHILKGFSFFIFPVLMLLSFSSFGQQKKKRIYTKKEITDTVLTEEFSQVPIDAFILKFTEGTKIRERGNVFSVPRNSIKAKEALLLQENQLDVDNVQDELYQLNAILKRFRNISIKRYFDRPEQEIEREQDSLEINANEELADLNLYYLIVVKSGDARQLINFLNSLKIVEHAYPVYKSENAVFMTTFDREDEPTLNVTKEFSDQQQYLDAAPMGINARYAWTIDGGKGDAVRIIDVENQWDIHHQDLKSPFWASSSTVNSDGTERGDHGTAVLGEVVAKHNQFGVKGISPEALYGISGVSASAIHTSAVSAAIDKAARLLKTGDIILIEQHTPGPKTGMIKNGCNDSQFEYVPMEFYQDCFDAIRRATAKGVIVVEAAGNGGVNLDAPVYKNLFNRKVRDSKAILVAADGGGNGIPTCWTNYGSRIDFFGWGDRIVTTGYGGFPNTHANVHEKYTNIFGGTSGASPIIVGAIASIQGIRRKMGLSTWTSELLRTNLIGTPQVPGERFIGVMPDLKATIGKMRSTR